MPLSDINCSNNLSYYCRNCKDEPTFNSLPRFTIHLRTYHCNIHKGNYICQYGKGDECINSTVSRNEHEFADHVSLVHINNERMST